MDEQDQPKIKVKESYFIEGNGKEIPLDNVPVYYVTDREKFRIRVSVVGRNDSYLGMKWIVKPFDGEGEFEVHETQIEIGVTEYYA